MKLSRFHKRLFSCSLFILFNALSNSLQAADNSVTAYGDRNPEAPEELSTFSFLVGKWQGKKVIPLEEGKQSEVEWIWIGRYILNGTAIADELHVKLPDGEQYLGVSFRQFDEAKKSWNIEYLNISNSFLRKQVNINTGSVFVENNVVTVISESEDNLIRETYEVRNNIEFTYRLNSSKDNGKSWGDAQMEMNLKRLD